MQKKLTNTLFSVLSPFVSSRTTFLKRIFTCFPNNVLILSVKYKLLIFVYLRGMFKFRLVGDALLSYDVIQECKRSVSVLGNFMPNQTTKRF